MREVARYVKTWGASLHGHLPLRRRTGL